MFIVCFLNWIKEPVTCLRDTSCDNHCLGVDDCHIVGKSPSKHLARASEHFNGHLITLIATFLDDSG